MNQKHHIPFFIALTLLVAAALKYLYAQSDTRDLSFLLAPVSFLVRCSLGGGIKLVRMAEGFYFVDLKILIDKSCSGASFFIILFCTLATTAPYRCLSFGRSALLFGGLLIVSLAVTLLVNTSRILGAILLLKLTPQFPLLAGAWVHEAEGVVVYLTSLLLVYAAVRNLYLKIENHAQYS